MARASFRIEGKDIEFLKAQWDNLLSFYPSDYAIKDELFQIVRKKYSESHRFYHNLIHIAALLKLFESLNDKIRDWNAVGFAIWFHDVVYDTKMSDNEEQSAKFASEILAKLNVDKETIEIVRGLILATKTHCGRNLSGDAKLFLDMDLAILGSSEKTYKEYSKAIREEYFWVSEPEYIEGRLEILKGFLDRESIYFTDEMKEDLKSGQGRI